MGRGRLEAVSENKNAVGPGRLQAILEVLMCSSVPTQLAIGGLLGMAGWEMSLTSLPFVMTVALGDTLVLITLMIVLMRTHGESPSQLWIGTRPLTREVLVGLLHVPLLIISANLLLNAIRLLAPSLHNVEVNPFEQLAASPLEGAALALVVVFAGGVKGELQRAFLLHRFEQHLGGARVGVVVVSVLFGLAHYTQGWDAAVVVGSIGFFWGVVYLRRRSTVTPIVSHATFDLLQVVTAAAR